MRRHAGGFTLLELCVVIAIAGIILAVGVPSYVSWRTGNTLRTAADTLASDIKLAQARAPQLDLTPTFDSAPISSGSAKTSNGNGYIPPISGSDNYGTATMYRVLLYEGQSVGWKELRREVVNDAIQMTVLPAGIDLKNETTLSQSTTAVAFGGTLHGLAFGANGALISAQPLTVQLSSGGKTETINVPLRGNVTVQQ